MLQHIPTVIQHSNPSKGRQKSVLTIINVSGAVRYRELVSHIPEDAFPLTVYVVKFINSGELTQVDLNSYSAATITSNALWGNKRQ